MAKRTRGKSRLALALASVGAFAVFSTGCMQYAPDGSVVTQEPPGQSDSSRLPSLLSQLQGAGAGIELLDGSASEVLAAQDAQGKEATTATATVAGEQTPGPAQTQVPQGTPTRAGTPARTPTPTRTPTQAPEDNDEPTATPTAAATATPTSTPTPTPTMTPTPVPTAPSEGGTGGGTPPTE
jgi:hypothetical protein